MRLFAVILATAALGGCGLSLPVNNALVSAGSPAFANNVNQPPQTVNSLPPGAAGLQSSGPNNTAPNYFGATMKAF